MSEPRTEAGRRVLGILQRLDAALPSIAKAAPIEWRNPILAIEQEAAALDVERLRQAISALHWTALAYPDEDNAELARDLAREYEKLRTPEGEG